MNKALIQKIALDSGFKLKEQPNGEFDLNPYVYKFAVDVIIEAFRYYQKAQETGNDTRMTHEPSKKI